MLLLTSLMLAAAMPCVDMLRTTLRFRFFFYAADAMLLILLLPTRSFSPASHAAMLFVTLCPRHCHFR